MILHYPPPGEEMTCTPVELPANLRVSAAMNACELNPCNAPLDMLTIALAGFQLTPDHLSLMTSKWWGTAAADLSVSFMEATPADLRDRILSHGNAWGEYGNVRFRWTQSGGQIRISRGSGGYYSYLGTDNLSIPMGQQTMNLQGFTMQTSEAEFRRVGRHEFGHALGCPHEHSLPGIIALLDREKCIAVKMRETGWSRQQVIQQVLTPPPLGSYRMSAQADVNGIMCYRFSGAETLSGQPIPGGDDIDAIDGAFFGTVYPKVGPPPPPVAPTIDLFRAVPPTIQLGGQSRLEWQTTGATSAALNGNPVLPDQVKAGSNIASPTATKKYTLAAMGPGGTVFGEVVVTVEGAPPPPPPDVVHVRRPQQIVIDWD